MQAYDWDALRNAIRYELDHKSWTRRRLAAEAGIATSSVNYLLNEGPPRRTPPSLAKVEEALGWSPGTAHDILTGRITYPNRVPMSPEVARSELDALEESRRQFESNPRYLQLPAKKRAYFRARYETAAERLQYTIDRTIGEITEEIEAEIRSSE